MLELVVDGVWTTTRPQRFWGLETGTRMTVVRLGDGALFVHSPVALGAAERRAIDALGPVRAIVAPSLFHHLYVGDWQAAYPDATVHPCPGLARKRPDVRWSVELGEQPDPAWAPDVDQALFTARFEREVVFFHRPSRTMICCDALLNLWHHPSRVTQFVAALMGNTAPGRGWPERIAVRDRPLARRQVDRILAWDIDRILLAHGACVERDGRTVVREAYAWL